MLNCLASLAMSTSVLKALPDKLDIKRHSPSILYLQFSLFIHAFGYNPVMLWLPNFITIKVYKRIIVKWPFHGHIPIIPL